MQFLLLGKFGQLGWELQRAMGSLGQVSAFDYPEIDLSEPESIRAVIARLRPQVIVNATAYTAVDRAEEQTELAYAVNSRAPQIMAEAARALGAALIHYSTDYVFDGQKGAAYVETDPANPLGVYGRSKLAGEQAIASVGGAYLIFRTSWVYSLRRDSFVSKVLEWARRQPVLRVVADQVSGPTWCRALAEVTAQLLAKAGSEPAGWLGARRGLYHLAGSGWTSRYDWARQILAFDPRPAEQIVRELQPALTAEFPTPAQRPLFSALDCACFSEAFGLRLPDWAPTLELALAP